MFIFDNGLLFRPHYIINFPTKTHWKYPSKMEYIDTGLKALIHSVQATRHYLYRHPCSWMRERRVGIGMMFDHVSSVHLPLSMK